MQGQRRLDKGFTLLELLMVVIIIAILASLALPQYFRATERSRTGQVLQLLGSLRGAQLRFKAQSPANVYDNAANMPNIDLAPIPGAAGGPALPAGWATVALTSNAAGANIVVTRNAGVWNNARMEVDLDSGNVCSNVAGAANDWSVGAPGC